MEPLIGFALLLLVVVTLVTIMSFRDRQHKERIEDAVRQVGGEPLAVTFKFVFNDRDNQHYHVQFADALGRKHETRCKANIWTGNIYWQQTPAEMLGDLPEVRTARGVRPEDGESSKEQIIADLSAENARLREALEQDRAVKGNIKPTG